MNNPDCWKAEKYTKATNNSEESAGVYLWQKPRET